MKFSATAITYGISDFRVKPVKEKTTTLPVVTPESETVELVPMELPQDLGEVLPHNHKWVAAIVTGEPPDDKTYPSRSEFVFAGTIWMLGNGVEPGYVLAILLDPNMGISAHVRDQPSPMACARRQVRQALTVIQSHGSEWPVVDDRNMPVKHHPENVRHALARSGVRAQRNSFTGVDEIEGRDLEGRDLTDVAEILCSVFARELQFHASVASIKRELITLAHEHRHHPVIDYLDGLDWDGTKRLDRWLVDYAGAADTELNRAFARKVLIAGVRRIRKPGVKFDTMLVLEGKQGAGKSQLAARLAVRPEWFCDSLDLNSDDKTKAEILQRAWIVECQELDGMNKSTSQKLKRFMSSPSDTFRKAYARDAGEYRRHCIIVGTTNEDTYLRDLTGNRRFWPVQAGDIDLEGFSAIVDQLWAEASMREAEGEAITLPEHLWKDAETAQTDRMMEDPYRSVLEDLFANKRGKVYIEVVKLALGIETRQMTSYDARRIEAIMASLGWTYGTYRLMDRHRAGRAPRKGYASGAGDEAKQEFIWLRLPNGEYGVVPMSPGETEPPF